MWLNNKIKNPKRNQLVNSKLSYVLRLTSFDCFPPIASVNDQTWGFRSKYQYFERNSRADCHFKNKCKYWLSF